MKLDFDIAKIEGFEWDRGNIDHIKKHKVGYKECEDVILGPNLIVIFDEKHSQKEKRYRVIGSTLKKRTLSLVVTFRYESVRVVMARDSNKKERKMFDEYKETSGGEKYE